MTNFCVCEEWNNNIDLMVAFISFGIEAGFDEDFYINLKPFKYCPWCGNSLMSAEELKTYVSK